jgi:thiamine pyrophosphokinase
MPRFDQQTGGAACPIFPKRGRRAVVLCDGPPPEPELLRYWLTGADAFVCTDAAGHPYDQLPATPDVVIGDFDALAGRILAGRGGPRFLQVSEQETTDSEKALLYLEEQGIAEAILLGATGWRIDHTLYNCSLLERFAGRLRLCVATDDADVVRLTPDEPVAWKLPVGTRFSLLSLGPHARGVIIEGASYPLLGGEIYPGGPATISNAVERSPLLISMTEGALLVAVRRTVDADAEDETDGFEDYDGFDTDDDDLADGDFDGSGDFDEDDDLDEEDLESIDDLYQRDGSRRPDAPQDGDDPDR